MMKSDKYKLTTAGKKLFQVLINPEYLGLSVGKLCQIANISRDTYYRLMKEEGFRDLVNETVLELVKGKIGNVINASYKYSLNEKGFQDRKMLLTMSGHYVEKVDNQFNGTVSVQSNPYDELTADQLRKLIESG